jgi:hypothetical protein
MFTAFAPPAMRYPPTATSSTSPMDGVPATNIGAMVVTSSSEMIRGFVSEMRSRTRLASPALDRRVRHVATSARRSVGRGDVFARDADAECAASAQQREHDDRNPHERADRLVQRAESGGNCISTSIAATISCVSTAPNATAAARMINRASPRRRTAIARPSRWKNSRNAMMRCVN